MLADEQTSSVTDFIQINQLLGFVVILHTHIIVLCRMDRGSSSCFIGEREERGERGGRERRREGEEGEREDPSSHLSCGSI